MTNKIAIALIAILVIAITVPTAYAALTPTKERFGEVCYNKETDGKFTFADFSCAVNIYKMYFDIISLFDKTDTLDSKVVKTSSQIETLFTKAETLRNADKVTTGKLNRASNNIEDLESRLQVLEGKVMPPTVPLTIHVIPNVLSNGEKFTIYGTADREEQTWVDFVVYDPNGTQVQGFDIETLQNGGFYLPPIEPSYKWITNGTYTITATHGGHESVNATIRYIVG